MKTKQWKRCLSLLLSFVMIIGMLPTQVFAEEVHVHTDECTVDHNSTEEITNISSIEETVEDIYSVSLSDEIRSELTEYIERYGLTADMPDSVLADVYISLEGPQAMEAWNTLEELAKKGNDLTQEEIDALLEEENTVLCQRFYNII